jgi:isoleucyl-tRNA synthetase
MGGDGETQTQVQGRIYDWLLKILPENKGKTIIIVSHSDPIDDLISILRGRSKHDSGYSLYGPEHTSIGKHRIVYLNNATKREIDLHKDSVDEIVLKCDLCGAKMKRVPDVLDTWFDSGSMPYAQMHYPFENKERFEQNFPAEFIAEGVDQTRAWFYYLHVLAVGIKNNFAYKNVIVNGIVLAEDGKKMSKRLKNYPDPEFLFEKYGADALRYYMLTSPVMTAENLNFSEKGVADCLRKVNMILWNVYKFYEMYATEITNDELRIKNLENSPLSRGVAEGRGVLNILDQWIVVRLNYLIIEVSSGMRRYDLPSATRPIVAFIDDLSTWYLRRSRERFKSEDEDVKQSALATTRYVLVELAKVMAPFTPFIAEQLWQKVTGNNFINSEKSVHLEVWPEKTKLTLVDSVEMPNNGVLGDAGFDIIMAMSYARNACNLGLAARDKAGIKVRQPLRLMYVDIKLPKISATQFVIDNRSFFNEIIQEEINVKKVELIFDQGGREKYIDNGLTNVEVKDGENFVSLVKTLTPELVAEGLKRELVRFINAERKNSGLTINDKIELTIATESAAVKEALKTFEQDLKKDVLAEKIIIGAVEGGKEVEANGEKLIIKIDKIT